MRRHRCTYCGDLGATVKAVDAADARHWFHAQCVDAARSWPVAIVAAGTTETRMPRKFKP